MDELTDLEKAQAAKISELMADNSRMRDSVVEVQRAFAAMAEHDAKRNNDKALRDHFAAYVLTGICNYTSDCEAMENWNVDRFATFAYRMANAMLEARKHLDE